MKISTLGVLSLLGLVVSVVPVRAGAVSVEKSPSTDRQAIVLRQLEEQRHQVSKQLQTPPSNKGPLLIRNMDRASKLDDLISRVRRGQPVSPDEIDRALQPTNAP